MEWNQSIKPSTLVQRIYSFQVTFVSTTIRNSYGRCDCPTHLRQCHEHNLPAMIFELHTP